MALGSIVLIKKADSRANRNKKIAKVVQGQVICDIYLHYTYYFC